MRIFPECGGLKTSPGHVTSLTAKLNEQRKTGNEDYCDITLTCSGTRFPVHKAILSASSPYFECLLEGQFAERSQNEIDLTESISDPETLECILEFIYTGNLLVEGSNFRELLGASSLLLLNNATELLTEYLKNSLVIANCLDIFQLAFKYSLGNISQICLNIIQARMHDYFCHGSKMLAVPPEMFVHLYNQNAFAHTSNQDIINVMKEYLEHLKASAAEVSQRTLKELYCIAQGNGISNSVFEGWLVHDQRENSDEKPSVTDKKENQSNEILLIREKESKDQINLIGWLSKPAKWVKLSSVNLTTLGCSSLGRFVGFAYDSLAFEINRQDIALVPLHTGQSRKVAGACGSECSDINYLHCPHYYFTAWNELFSVYPETEVKDFNSDDSDDSWGYGRTRCIGYDNEKKVIMGYVIAQYSLKRNRWEKETCLELPDAYENYQNYYDGCGEMFVWVRFQISINNKNVLLMITPAISSLITVMKLTLDQSGKLKYQEIFHSDKMYANRSHCLAKSTSTYLRFQEITFPKKKPTNPSTYTVVCITQVKNLKTNKMGVFKINADKFTFPWSEFDEFRTAEEKTDEFATLKKDEFVTSMQSGLIHYIDSVMPYVTMMWIYDPVKNEWKSLPGPPLDGEISSLEIREVPAKLLHDLTANAPAFFEDKHGNPKHGPFGQSKG